jgi:hypothetical protein
MGREHDRPDPNLIHGSWCLQMSKRGQGNDYPVTPLEELQQWGKQSNDNQGGG